MDIVKMSKSTSCNNPQIPSCAYYNYQQMNDFHQCQKNIFSWNTEKPFRENIHSVWILVAFRDRVSILRWKVSILRKYVVFRYKGVNCLDLADSKYSARLRVFFYCAYFGNYGNAVLRRLASHRSRTLYDTVDSRSSGVAQLALNTSVMN